MSIPYISEIIPELKRSYLSIKKWLGLNQNEGAIKNGEIFNMYNMSSDNFPFASPRKPRKTIAKNIALPKALFKADEKLGYINGSDVYYDKVGDNTFTKIGECEDVTSIIEMNKNVLFFPSKKYYNFQYDEFDNIKTELIKQSGSYDANGEYSTNCDDIYFQYKNSTDYAMADTYVVKTSESELIKLPLITDKYGNTVRTKYGLNTYGSIKITQNNIDFLRGDGLTLTDGCVKTTVCYMGFSDSGEILTKKDGYSSWFYETDFDTDIGGAYKNSNGILEYIASVKIMICYYAINNNSNTVSTNEFIDARNDDLNNETIKIYVTSNDDFGTGYVPDISYACIDNNRVFGVNKSNIYASALGKIYDWSTFFDADGKPSETGAYATDVDSSGDFSGIVKFNGNIIAFKEDLIYIIYGNKPPYRINEFSKAGCIDSKSICVIGSYLYWLGRNGIYRFGGGQPQCISNCINYEFSSGTCGSDGTKYYCCLKNGENSKLFVFDTRYNFWHIEDDINVLSFVDIKNELYALTSDGKIIAFDGENEIIEWNFETKPFSMEISNKKRLEKINIRVFMDLASSMDVFVAYDNGDYLRVASFSNINKNVFEIPLAIKKCDSFSLKFSGTGNAKIMDINATAILSDEKHKYSSELSLYRE